MKTAMFVLGIIELIFLCFGAFLNSKKIDLNNCDDIDFSGISVLYVIVWIAIALSVLSIIEFCR